MPRSITVCAAALLLASFSGSGSMLTTAEAMPAPGPQQTQGQPRYYFPRHVKRQIVTNSTAPAAPTSASPERSRSSSEELQSRQDTELFSRVGSFFRGDPDPSSSSIGAADPTSAVPSTQGRFTPPPETNDPPAGTGNLRPPPPPVQSSSSSADEIVLPPPAKQTPTPTPTPSSEPPTQEESPSISPSQVGSTSPAPLLVLLPTEAASPSASEPASAISSSAQEPLINPTGQLPLSFLTATPSISVPDILVTPTPSLALSATPSADPSSFLGPFIIGTPSESVAQPSSSVGLLNSLLSPILDPLLPTPTPELGTTGFLPSSVIQPTSAPEISPSAEPLLSFINSGIVVGLTTALGTGDLLPTPTAPIVTSAPIPTSDQLPASSGLLDLPPILSSVVSEVNGILPSGTDLGPTAPVVTPTDPVVTPLPSLSGILPPILSTLVPDLPSILSSVVSEVGPTALPSALSSIFSGVETLLPTASAPIPISSVPLVLPSSEALISSGLIPSSEFVPSGLPTQSPSAPASVPPSVTPPVATPSVTGVEPSTGIVGTSASPVPTISATPPLSVPASEGPSSATLSAPPGSATVSAQNPTNATISDAVTSRPSDTPTIAIPTIPSITPTPVVSLVATATDSKTNFIVGTSIIREPSTMPSPSATVSSIPSSLPKMIAPPEGVPPTVPEDSFMGQVCFKWPLNYPFVSANDGGNQIFHYLPIAIADGLDIPLQSVKNFGLKPIDTLQWQGFITTAALFTIPKDVQGNLQAALRNPADTFWHNKNSTVNDLTGLINTACPLPAGRDNNTPNQVTNPAATNSGTTDGGALGGDIGASRKVNSTSAIVASSAIVGAIAYGAAMFFVARRYRNKRIAHQRSSSVPSTSRMTYGSIPGGAAAWMHGARNGRITPGSRGSHGSSSTQGRSIRTQQISAPVMAENSLGWN